MAANEAPESATRRMRLNSSWALTLMVGVGAGLIFADFLRFVGGALQGLLIVLLISLFLSFAMEPAVQWMAKRGMRRGVGTAIVFGAVILILSGFAAAMAPLIIDQATNLVEAGPDLLRNLSTQAQRLPQPIAEPLTEWLANQQASANSPEGGGLGERVASSAAALGADVLGGVFQTLTIALVTFYLVADGPKLRRALSARMPARQQASVLSTWELAIEKTGGYVYSRLVTAITSSIIHVVALTLIDLPYAFALGAWVGLVSSLIPVIGTYLAGALPLVVALANDPIDAIWVLVTITIYQALENFVIGPKITEHTMELHPAVALTSVLAGGALLGATGALLALPAVAIIQALITASGERHDVLNHSLLDEHESDQRAGIFSERRRGADRRSGEDRRKAPRDTPDRRKRDRRAPRPASASTDEPSRSGEPARTDTGHSAEHD